MTAAELLARVEATPIAPAWQLVPYTYDWGSPRQRSRRRSLLRSAMHDGPRGVRTYHRLPDGLAPEERLDVDGLGRSGIPLYLRGRSAGLGHDAAFLLVLWRRGEAEESVLFALDEAQTRN